MKKVVNACPDEEEEDQKFRESDELSAKGTLSGISPGCKGFSV